MPMTTNTNRINELTHSNFTPSYRRINLTEDKSEDLLLDSVPTISPFNQRKTAFQTPQKKNLNLYEEPEPESNSVLIRQSLVPSPQNILQENYQKNYTSPYIKPKSYLERLAHRDYDHPCEQFQSYMQELKKQITQSRKLKTELLGQPFRGNVEIPNISGCKLPFALLIYQQKNSLFWIWMRHSCIQSHLVRVRL